LGSDHLLGFLTGLFYFINSVIDVVELDDEAPLFAIKFGQVLHHP
jgi:hypothetical protein